MSEYIINKKSYSEAEISALSRTDFSLRYLQEEKPLKLYKYFPNTEKDGRNYSIEALKNNTVHLQNPLLFDDPYDSTLFIESDVFALSRIKYYANLCNIKIDFDWDYSKIFYELALFLHNYIDSGNELEKLFLNEYDDYNQVHLRQRRFLLTLQNNLIKYKDHKYVWQIAINEVINSDFIEAKDFINKFRVSCFSTSPYSMLMWSHYANSHKGFCVEYEIPNFDKDNPDLFINLFPVIYSDQRTNVLPYCMAALENKDLTDETLWSMYKYGLLTKSMDWQSQDEWRLISYDKMLAQDNEYNCRFFDIKKVYLGAKMPKAERLKIIDICKDKIPYVGVLPSMDKFLMIDCLGKCEECNKIID